MVKHDDNHRILVLPHVLGKSQIVMCPNQPSLSQNGGDQPAFRECNQQPVGLEMKFKRILSYSKIFVVKSRNYNPHFWGFPQ